MKFEMERLFEMRKGNNKVIPVMIGALGSFLLKLGDIIDNIYIPSCGYHSTSESSINGIY